MWIVRLLACIFFIDTVCELVNAEFGDIVVVRFSLAVDLVCCSLCQCILSDYLKDA